MATHSIILAWRIPWTEEPGGLQPIGHRVGRGSRDSAALLPEPWCSAVTTWADPGTEPRSPALQADSLLSEPPGVP